MTGTRPISLVAQRTPTDCTVCCLAMLTGRPYGEIIERIGDVFDPAKGMEHEDEALKRLGFGDSLFAKMRRDWCVSYEGFRALVWGRRAIIAVPSLNYPDLWHSVFWDGERVLDPSPGKTYGSWNDLKPEEIIIFREHPHIIPETRFLESP